MSFETRFHCLETQGKIFKIVLMSFMKLNIKTDTSYGNKLMKSIRVISSRPYAESVFDFWD